MKRNRILSILLILSFLLVVGCGGNSLTKSCDSLTDVSEFLNQVQVQMQIDLASDPNLDLVGELNMINQAQSVIQSLTGSICALKNL